MGRLDGKVALITGTAGGQGRAAALLFAAEGAKVVGCDVKEPELNETGGLIAQRGHGGNFRGRVCDIASDEQFQELVEYTVATFGPIDVLYNNGGSAKFAPIWEMTREQWNFTIRNELDVIFVACRAVAPRMMARRSGSIINTASIAGMIGMEMRGAPEPFPQGGVAHCAAKGGVIAITRALAQELGPYNVRVNSIAPGLIDTPVLAERMKNPQYVRAGIETSVLGRIGKPEDIAPCALYLASDESSFVTGANFVVDGGWTCV
ncbi:MAG: SDR family NAD(P)-dependent oxidoreductase [Candidatus Binatia bacterium]